MHPEVERTPPPGGPVASVRRVMMVAGEASGDAHGASLVGHLKDLIPGVEVMGIGGSAMMRAGVRILIDSSEVSVVGLIEVIRHIGVIRKAFNLLEEAMQRERPDLILLIDFPDFNLRVARTARRLGIPVLYYISPQVWAWRRGRVKEIARLVDRMLVIFPFEVPIYETVGLDVEFVGHPLADGLPASGSAMEILRELGLPKGARPLGLLPGSRRTEIRHILPCLLKAAEIVWRRDPSVHWILPVAPTLRFEDFSSTLKNVKSPVTLVDGRVEDLLPACDAAMVASGTATLQAGLAGTPMVIVYRANPLTYHIVRLLVDVEFIGLVNIVSEKRVVEELIQNKASPEAISREILRILDDRAYRDRIRRDLDGLREKLGPGDASRRAARAVHAMLEDLKP